MQERNQGINLLKAIGCIGIVFIHVRFPGVFGIIMYTVPQFGVPVFFMIAGYYSYDCDSNKIKNRLTKILKILSFGYFWFFAYNIAFQLFGRGGDLSNWLLRLLNWRTPIFYIIFCTVEFAPPLWYLIAMAEVYSVWFFIVKKHKENTFVNLTPVLFILGITLTTTCETLGLPWSLQINFITSAMPWFLFGYKTKRDNNALVNKVSNVQLVVTAIAATIASLMPELLHTTINFRYACVVFSATALFLLAIKNPTVKTGKFVQYLGDKLSLYIYIFHVIISAVLYGLLARIVHIGAAYYWIHPLLVVVISIVAAIAFEKMKLVKK